MKENTNHALLVYNDGGASWLRTTVLIFNDLDIIRVVKAIKGGYQPGTTKLQWGVMFFRQVADGLPHEEYVSSLFTGSPGAEVVNPNLRAFLEDPDTFLSASWIARSNLETV